MLIQGHTTQAGAVHQMIELKRSSQERVLTTGFTTLKLKLIRANSPRRQDQLSRHSSSLL